jgi:hypothetical protein
MRLPKEVERLQAELNEAREGVPVQSRAASEI